jgi:hypothetical protein
VKVAQDPVAGPNDRGRLSINKAAKRIAVAIEDGLDDPKRLIVVRRFGSGIGCCVAFDGDD